MRTEIKIALAIGGMSQATIANIETAEPAAARMVALFQKIEPELMTATVKADFTTLLPVLAEILTFVKGT